MSLIYIKGHFQEPTIYLNYVCQMETGDGDGKTVFPYQMPTYENKTTLGPGKFIEFKIDVIGNSPCFNCDYSESCSGGFPYIAQKKSPIGNNEFSDSCKINKGACQRYDRTLNLNESLEGGYFELFEKALDKKKITSKKKIVHIRLTENNVNRRIKTWVAPEKAEACGFEPTCTVTCADRVSRQMLTLGKLAVPWTKVPDDLMQCKNLKIKYTSAQVLAARRRVYDYEPYSLSVSDVDYSFFGSLEKAKAAPPFDAYNKDMMNYAKSWLSDLFTQKDGGEKNVYVFKTLKEDAGPSNTPLIELLLRLVCQIFTSLACRSMYLKPENTSFRASVNFSNSASVSEQFIGKIFEELLSDSCTLLDFTGQTNIVKNIKVFSNSFTSVVRPPGIRVNDNGDFIVTLTIDKFILDKVRQGGKLNRSSCQDLLRNYFDEKEVTKVLYQGFDFNDLPDIEVEVEETAPVEVAMVSFDLAKITLLGNGILGQKDNETVLSSDGEVVNSWGSSVVALCYSIQMKLKRLTPLILVYLLSCNNINPTQRMCELLEGQSVLTTDMCSQLYNTGGTQTLDEHLKRVLKSCEYTYKVANKASYPKLALSGLIAKGSTDSTGVEVCACSDADIAPPVTILKNEKASRCFSSTCTNPLYRAYYNLDAGACEPFCSQVRSWVVSRNPLERGEDLSAFDWVRYDMVCGKDDATSDPTANDKKTTFVTVATLVTFLVALIAGFFIYRARRYETPHSKAKLSLYALFVICLCLSFYFLLPGEPWCKGDGTYPARPICKSILGGFRVFDEMCTTKASCDCVSATDCGAGPNDAICSRYQVCLTRNGERPSKLNDKIRFNGTVLFFGLLCTVFIVAATTIVARLKRLYSVCLAISLVLVVLSACFLFPSDMNKYVYEDFDPSFKSRAAMNANFISISGISTNVPLTNIVPVAGDSGNATESNDPVCLTHKILESWPGALPQDFIDNGSLMTAGYYTENYETGESHAFIYAPGIRDGADHLYKHPKSENWDWGNFDRDISNLPCQRA